MEETKICPYCAEVIKEAAIVCKHCGKDFPTNTFNLKEKEHIDNERFKLDAKRTLNVNNWLKDGGKGFIGGIIMGIINAFLLDNVDTYLGIFISGFLGIIPGVIFGIIIKMKWAPYLGGALISFCCISYINML